MGRSRVATLIPKEMITEELLEDRAAGGADCLADDDLPGSFGDCDQHAVQHADAADNR
jgi:hypothetical protein